MIPEWKTNRVLLAAALCQRHPRLWKRLQPVFTDHQAEFGLVQDTPDIWVRDFAPVQVAEDEFVKFRYEPDYLQDGFKHLMKAEHVANVFCQAGRCRRSNINLDGGNLVTSGQTVILTEKVFRENPDYGRPKLERLLNQLLRVEECVFIPPEPGDPLGHADGVVRFIEAGRVLVNDYSAVNKRFGRRLREVLKRHHLDVEEMPYFGDDEITSGIPSAVGCYVNYLRTSKLIVVPVYGVKVDDRAVRKLEAVFPGGKIVPTSCRELAKEGGVLNCISWTTFARNPKVNP